MENEALTYLLVLIIILIALAIYAVQRGKKSIYYAALYFVTVAEETFGSRTGRIKFAQVMAELKRRFPILSLFIRQKVFEETIETALEVMKRILQEKAKAEETEEDSAK